MKMRLMTSLAIAMLLIASLTLPAAADVLGTSNATVTVNSDISVTIIDGGAANIVFGALDAGTSDNPDTTASDTIPSITLSVSGTSVVDLQVSGTDFGTGFAVSNAKFNTSYSTTGTTAMSTSPVQIADGVNPETDVEVWFWLDVPASGVIAGSYSSTFTFEATED
jgi:hypothetical protein